jgi:hypothetical protein
VGRVLVRRPLVDLDPRTSTAIANKKATARKMRTDEEQPSGAGQFNLTNSSGSIFPWRRRRNGAQNCGIARAHEAACLLVTNSGVKINNYLNI